MSAPEVPSDASGDPVPEGWETVIKAVDILDGLGAELIEVHDSALRYGMSQAERLGDDHPPGLACGCTGAPLYAAALMQLLGRHLHGVCALARLHPGFVYPARTLSRATLDHAGRILWLLEPESVEEREVRFLAAKAEESRLNLLVDPDSKEPDWEQIADKEYAAKLPRIPSFQEMATLFPMPDLIVQTGYRELSQASHGTTIGTATLNQDARRRLPGEAGNVPEFIAAAFWTDLLEVAALCSHAAKLRFVERLAPDHDVNREDVPKSVFELMATLPPPVKNRDAAVLETASAPKPNRKARRAAEAHSRKSER